jgi:outer membrane protein assembly factor BamB
LRAARPVACSRIPLRRGAFRRLRPDPLARGRTISGTASTPEVHDGFELAQRFLVPLAVIVAGVPGSVALAEALFRGDPTHSGVYPSPKVPALDRVKWKFKTGSRVVSSPAVVGGTVYIGSADHFVYALSAADGSVKWRYKTGGAVNSSPAVATDRVFVSSLDGDVYALDAVDGTLKWKFKTGGERRFTAPGIHGVMPRTELMPDPFDLFLSSPTVVGKTVYAGSGDHRVYAVDAESGAMRRAFGTGNVVHARPRCPPAWSTSRSWDRNLYALDARTGGALIWKFQTGDDTDVYNQVGIASSAAVAGGTVFLRLSRWSLTPSTPGSAPRNGTTTTRRVG